jgi:hypothetical protein
MGASLQSCTFRSQNRSEIERKWNSAVEQSRQEDGTSYSGCIGMLGTGIACWHDKKFNSLNEADEFLSDEHDKWERAIAVSYRITAKASAADILAADGYRNKAYALSAEIAKLRAEGVNEYKQSEFITCPSCHSRMATKFLLNEGCKLCNNSLFGKRLQNKIAKLVEQKTELEKKSNEMRMGKPSDEFGWLVGGWCSE